MPAPPRRRLLRPSSWPLAVKLGLALLFASLVPMSLTAVYNLVQGLSTLERFEHRNLQLFAASTAGRIDQLLVDTQQVVAQIAGDAEVASFLASPAAERRRFAPSVQQTLENVVRANPDIFSVFLLDDRGGCTASTNAENLEQSYAFRDYFKGAAEGRPFVSELLTGSTTKRPGVYFSHPVKDAANRTIGVAVLKMTGESISSMVESVHVGGAGRAFLIDPYGVVISHADRAFLYHSLGVIPADILAGPAFDHRFSSIGVARIEPLGLDGLAHTLLGATAPGNAQYTPPGQKTRQIVGYAPLKRKAWVLAVEEPSSEFAAPLERLARQSTMSVVVVGVLITALALFLARSIVRPIRRLTEASEALARGDYEAGRIAPSADDEIGALSRAFATMAAGLKERERERDVFGRVVSPEVREKLLGGELGLGGETRWVAVLFSDIRGFSTMSERMDPQAVVALLNEYLTEMAEAVVPYNGYINNFIGDAIVVIFGAPIARPDVESRAVNAALAMRRRLADLNERREARGDARIETGIGVSAGEVVAGQIGSLERMLYTVIGDAVNVAARLESLTKDYPGHPILVTRAIADALPGAGGVPNEPAGFTVTQLGKIKVKGRTEPVDLCAVDAA